MTDERIEPKYRYLVVDRSAYESERRNKKLAMIGGVASFVSLCFLLFKPAADWGAWPGVAVFICLAGILLMNWHQFGWGHHGPAEAERRAGYTTEVLPHQPELDLCDYRNGRVLRAAGEPPMSQEDFDKALREPAPSPQYG